MRKRKLKFLAGVALAAVFAIGVATAIAAIVNGVEIDGNIRFNGAGGAVFDWASADGSGTSTGCIIDEIRFETPTDLCTDGEDDHVRIDDPTSEASAVDPNIFGGGAKETDDTTWSFVDGNVPSKDDFNNIYGWHDQDSLGDEILYAGFEKRVQSGDTHLDLELSQEVQNCGINVGTPDEDDFLCPVRNIGDLILAFDLNPDSGPPTKEALSVKLFQIIDDGAGNPIFDEVPLLEVAVTNAQRAALGLGIDLSDDIDPTLCTNLDPNGTCPANTLVVAVNNGTIVAGPWGSSQGNNPDATSVARTNFFEMSLNLSEIGKGPSCPGSAFITPKTRSSNSIDAQLKDTAESAPFDLSTCGQIIIKKETDGGFGSFDYSSDLPTSPPNPPSNSFTLETVNDTDAVMITFPQVTPGAYEVNEDTLETGFQLKSLTCVDATNDSDQDAVIPTQANINVASLETVTCTYVNEALAQLTIKKTTIPAGGTGFLFDSADVPFTDVPLDDTQTHTVSDLTPGTYVVTEDDPSAAGWQLTGISCTGTDTGTATTFDVSTGTATFNLDAGDDVTCEFTNERATLELKKEVVNACLGNADDGGNFDLDVVNFGNNPDGDEFDDGESTGDLHPLHGTYGITESAGDITDLGDYDSKLEGAGCDGGDPATSGSVTLDDADDVTCTFTNVRKAEVTVCKALSPTNDTGTFDLVINATEVFDEASDGDCDTLSISVPEGFTTDVTVSENGGEGADPQSTTDDTSLSDYQTVISCDNGQTDGSFPVITGETVSCTITNVRKVAQSICPTAD